MATKRNLRVEASERACLECQKRKSRCIIPTGADNEICTYCFKKGKACVFADRPKRTPLTRKNLDQAERRCRELELMLNQRNKHASPQHDPSSTYSNPDTIVVQPSLNDGANNGNGQAQHEDERHQDEDVTMFGSNEWNGASPPVDVNGQDGMASLAGKDAGYLGSSSGSHLLQSLSVYLSPSKSTPTARLHSENHNNPNLAQNLLSVPELTASRNLALAGAHGHFVNAYFLAYNTSYPIIHERTFRERCLKKAQLRPNDVWHAVYFTVLAIGEWVCGYATDQQSMYYEAARSRLSFDVLESGNTGVVQAFLLLGNFLQKTDRPNIAYNFIGIAYRVALGLGLHRELPAGVESQKFVLQQRRALFWILYCFDSGLSMTTGRPTMVADTFIDIHKPTNLDDTISTASTDILHEVDNPTTYSAIIAQSRLAVIANKVYSNFLSVRACSDVEDLVATIEQTLRNWRVSLPAFFHQPNVPQWFLGPRQVLFWKEANLQITLLIASRRNHVEEQDKISISTKCQAIAISTILDISHFCLEHRELIHVGLSWYAVYFLLHALLALGVHQLASAKKGTTWSHVQGQDDSHSPQSATAKARECLEMLGNSNRAAFRTLLVLDRIEEALSQSQPSATNGATITTNPHVARSNTQTQEQTATNQRQSIASMADFDQNFNGSNVIGPNMNTTQPEFPGTSPDGPYADYVMSEWVATADPSLHFFLDNEMTAFNDVFEGMQGFPNVLDGSDFGYMTSTMHSVRVPDSTQHHVQR